jgi:hypothetical protein
MPDTKPAPNALVPVVTEPAAPTEPAVRLLSDDILAKLKYSFVSVAAEEHPAADGTLDATFREFLESRSTASRTRFRAGALALRDAPIAVRGAHFGRYSSLSHDEYKTIGSDKLAARFGNVPVGTHGEPFAALVNSYHAKMAVGPVVLKLPEKPEPPKQAKFPIKLDPDVVNGLFYKKLQLFITRVHCTEETSEIGSDEINLGGTATDPSGKTGMIPEFVVSTDFDEGETVYFNPPRVLFNWNLATQTSGYPYVYGAVLVMAEKDDGGFYKFLKALWEKVSVEVKAAIGGLVGAAIGAALGSIIPGIGTVSGALGGFLVGLLVDWIIGLFDNPDDIVAVKPLMMSLGWMTKSYYDWAKLTTPAGFTGTLHFNGDGGRYEVDYGYKVLG